MSLVETLGNDVWMSRHSDEIKNMLPETWTHIANINGLQLGFRMKLLGIDWRSEDEFAKVMMYFEKVGLLRRDGLLVRRSN